MPKMRMAEALANYSKIKLISKRQALRYRLSAVTICQYFLQIVKQGMGYHFSSLKKSITNYKARLPNLPAIRQAGRE